MGLQYNLKDKRTHQSQTGLGFEDALYLRPIHRIQVSLCHKDTGVLVGDILVNNLISYLPDDVVWLAGWPLQEF